jgi:hypothetical protein
MGRVYAGILGTLAMAVVICRGALESGGVENTLSLAIVYLVLFSLVGALIGQIAQATVDESVRSKLEQQLAAGVEKSGA